MRHVNFCYTEAMYNTLHRCISYSKMRRKCFWEPTLSQTHLCGTKHSVRSWSHRRLVSSELTIKLNDDNVEKVKEPVVGNRRVGIKVIAEDLNIYGSTQYFLVNILGIKHIDTLHSYQKICIFCKRWLTT